MDQFIVRVNRKMYMDVCVFADSRSEARKKARTGDHYSVLENEVGKVISTGPAFLIEPDEDYI